MGIELPIGLALLLALPLIWYLHRIQRRTPEVRLHAFFLLPLQRRRGRGAGGAWRDRLRLALRLLLAVVMALALAEPWWSSVGPERAVAVLPHGLAATLPTAGGATAYEASLDTLDAALKELKPHRVLVLLAGPEPVAAAGWGSVEEALAAARQRPPAPGPQDMSAALREAQRLAGPEGQVLLPPTPTPQLTGNRGLVSVVFAAHRSVPERGLILVRVRSTGASRTVTLRLDTSEGPLAVTPVAVDADGVSSASLRYDGPGGVDVRVHIVGSDPFALDDEAWLSIPPLRRQRVALLGDSNPELLRALAALPRVAVEAVAPGAPLDGYDFAVVAPGADIPAPVPGAPPLVLVGVGAAADGGASTPLEAAADLPPLRTGLQLLGRLHPPTLRALPAPPDDAEVLATAAGRPAVWRSARGPVRLALAFDPGAAGLRETPLHAALWDDLLDPLLLPPHGGCAPVLVGTRTPAGVLTRAGVFRAEGACYVARLVDWPGPTAPPEQSAPQGVWRIRGAHRRPLWPGLLLLALALVLVDRPLAGLFNAQRRSA